MSKTPCLTRPDSSFKPMRCLTQELGGKITNRSFLLSFAMLVLSACTAEYEDIGSHAPYRNIVGKQLSATSKLYIYGVTLDRNYAAVVDVYTAHAPPGIGGPEVLSSAGLPPGTIFNVTGVRRCTNCPSDEVIDIVVQVAQNPMYDDAPVTIPYKLFVTGVVTIAP